MSDAADETAHVRDGSEFDPPSSAAKVGEPGSPGDAPIESVTSHHALIQLMRLGPDTVIDQLCEGRPRDFRGECALHVADSAYFIEEGRVAARVIATLAALACEWPSALDQLELTEQLETIVEESTAEVLEEGALPHELGRGANPTNGTGVCRLTARIGLVLGLDDEGAHAMIDVLNSFDFEDRHVLYHCIVEGLTPEQYARKFDDDARVVTVMLRQLAAQALDGRSLDG
jgi:hypothetical protein